MTELEQQIQGFLGLLKEISLLEETDALLGWDALTGMPEDSSEHRSEVTSYIAGLAFEKSVSKSMADYLTYLSQHQEDLNSDLKKMVEIVQKNYDLNHKIPQAEYQEFIKVISQADSSWRKARDAQDFTIFEPSLAKIIAFKKKFIEYWHKDEKTPYDVLLNQYEPGMTVEILDAVFTELREGIQEIVKKINEKGTTPTTDFLSRYISIENQRAFSIKVIEKMGYRFTAGRLDDTTHPFMESMNRNDARITTRWDEHNFKMAVFGIIHEAGHGIYEQNIAERFDYTPLRGGVSMGIHESQSLFYEIVMGSDKNFWQDNYELLQSYSEGKLDDIDFETFYKGLHKTAPSLIRIEADTLTYPLHIIIRYEIEKLIFNEGVSVSDLPQIWNEKYQEYLGITPENDTVGILQDVHWSGGSFGYFPSYALGFMYAAQLQHSMAQEIDLAAIYKTGNYEPIRQWLTDNIHQYGSLKEPNELIKNATGEPLNPRYLLALQGKIYQEVYHY